MVWRNPDRDLVLCVGGMHYTRVLTKVMVMARVRSRITAPPRVTGNSTMATAGLLVPFCPIALTGTIAVSGCNAESLLR